MPSIDYIIDLLNNHPYLPYLIVLAWTFVEGETIVIIAGIAAQDDGKPYLPLIVLAAFFGSLSSDQLMFFLGRYKGKKFVAKRPFLQKRAESVYRILERHQTLLILGFRFLYGVRNVTPLAVGMSEVTTRRFMTLNIIGAAVWAFSFAYGGYLFGQAMEQLFENRTHKLIALGVIAGIVFLLWLYRLLRRHAAAKAVRQAEALAARQATPAVAPDPAPPKDA